DERYVAYAETTEGAIEFDALPPGSYVINAWTEDFRWAGIGSVRVEPYEIVPVTLELEPAARLLMTYAGAERWVDLEVFRSGDLVGSTWLEPGLPERMVVPPGRLVVRLTYEDRRTLSREVEAGVGEELEVTFP
ncbi:MAG: hypothetical protein O7B99_15645, partial [Planctomycetota bacterium]|nr:hypothetical protein [Planctomycetota bacterium]